MADISAKKVIEDYKEAVKELGKDPNPGHKAIVVYGGFMGKSFHTYNSLHEIGLDDCYDTDIYMYNKPRKDWVYSIICNNRKKRPLIVIDSYKFSYYSCKKSVPEYKELVKSIPTGKFGFTLSKPYIFQDLSDKTDYTIPAGFYEITSNLVFLIGYAIPKDLIAVMPSFNFNFDVKQLLAYIRETIDTFLPEYGDLSHDDRLALVDFLAFAYEQGAYDKLDLKGIRSAFFERNLFETEKKDNSNTKDLNAVLKHIIYDINFR
jgi:hypothetical protein